MCYLGSPTLTVSLQTANSTSLTIAWRLDSNSSCWNQSLVINMQYNKVGKCNGENDVPSQIDTSISTSCFTEKTFNTSQAIRSKNNSFHINRLSSNSTYQLQIKLSSLICKGETVILNSSFVTLGK